jgi:glutamate racemase
MSWKGEFIMDAPIGVFDSGVGGLTVAREIMRQLPCESLVYFGDTARVPYGSKSKKTICKYSRQIANFLLTQHVKAIVIACNTASALAMEELKNMLEVPVIDVVQPGARMAAASTKNKNIGVLGTQSTIKSGIYERYLHELDPELTVVSKACPLFVPLVEEGLFEDRITEDVVGRYLHDMKEYEIDALVLGCTHYPLLRGVIGREVGEGVKLVNPAYETAKSLKEMLREKDLLASGGNAVKHKFFVSDGVEQFLSFADSILPCHVEETTVVDIESY